MALPVDIWLRLGLVKNYRPDFAILCNNDAPDIPNIRMPQQPNIPPRNKNLLKNIDQNFVRPPVNTVLMGHIVLNLGHCFRHNQILCHQDNNNLHDIVCMTKRPPVNIAPHCKLYVQRIQMDWMRPIVKMALRCHFGLNLGQMNLD